MKEPNSNSNISDLVLAATAFPYFILILFPCSNFSNFLALLLPTVSPHPMPIEQIAVDRFGGDALLQSQNPRGESRRIRYSELSLDT